jgi:hypothetical protein
LKQSRGRAAAAAGAAAHSVEETTPEMNSTLLPGGSHVKELFVSHDDIDESTTLGFIYTNIKPKSCTTSSTCKSTPFSTKVQFYCGQTPSPNLKFPTILFFDGLTTLTFLPLRGNEQAVHPPRQLFVEKVPTKNGKKKVWRLWRAGDCGESPQRRHDQSIIVAAAAIAVVCAQVVSSSSCSLHARGEE